MTQKIKPDAFSFCSIPIDVIYGENVISIATGFLWQYEQENYLITNWHVVSGFHPETNQPLDFGGTTPDLLRVHLHLAENLGKWESHDVQLSDNQGRPLWKVHKDFATNVDVVVIKIQVPEKFKAFPINVLPSTKSHPDFEIKVGQDVFILGYPRGITGGGRLPVWKRGSIASEPEINLDNLPKILIDSFTRDGMSGSPVIAQFIGIHIHNEGTISPDDWLGESRKILGIYSGRLGTKDSLEASLGIVWKISVIEEIIKDGIRPN